MGHPVQSKKLDEKSVERKRGVFGSFYVTAKAVTHKAHSTTVAENAPRAVGAARERLLARLKPCPDAVKSVPPFEKRGDGAPGTKQRLDEKSVERKRGIFSSVYVTAEAVTHKAQIPLGWLDPRLG